MQLYLKSMLCKSVRTWNLVVIQLEILIFALLIILHEVCHYAMAILLGLEVIEVRFLIPISREEFLQGVAYDVDYGRIRISRTSAHNMSTLSSFLLSSAPIILAVPIVVFVCSVLLSKYNFLIAILGCICCYILFPSCGDLNSFSYCIRKNKTTSYVASFAWLILKICSSFSKYGHLLFYNTIKYSPIILLIYLTSPFFPVNIFIGAVVIALTILTTRDIKSGSTLATNIPYFQVFPESNVAKILRFFLCYRNPQNILPTLIGINVQLDKTTIKEFTDLFPNATPQTKLKNIKTYRLTFSQDFPDNKLPFPSEALFAFNNNGSLESISVIFKENNSCENYRKLEESFVKNFCTRWLTKDMTDQFARKDINMTVGGNNLYLKYFSELRYTALSYLTAWSLSYSRCYTESSVGRDGDPFNTSTQNQ